MHRSRNDLDPQRRGRRQIRSDNCKILAHIQQLTNDECSRNDYDPKHQKEGEIQRSCDPEHRLLFIEQLTSDLEETCRQVRVDVP